MDLILCFLYQKKSLLLLIIFSFFFLPKFLRAQDSKPSFYLYGNCRILDEDKNIGDLIKEVRSQQNTESDNNNVDVPKRIANAEIRPLVNAVMFSFSNSKLVSSGKVTKIFLLNNEIADWELHYQTDLQKAPKDSPGVLVLNGGLDVSFDKSIDAKKLEALNAQNDKFIKSNVLSLIEIDCLGKEISKVVNVNQQATPQPMRAMKGQEAFDDFDEEVSEGRWKPDYLLPNWKNNSNLQFSIKFPSLNCKVAIYKCADLGSFIVCMTKKGMFFYPFDRNGTGSHFDQIINCFGDFYISFFENGVGGYETSVYEITDDGLKLVGAGGVSFD